jgi:transcription elongation factor GreA
MLGRWEGQLQETPPPSHRTGAGPGAFFVIERGHQARLTPEPAGRYGHRRRRGVRNEHEHEAGLPDCRGAREAQGGAAPARIHEAKLDGDLSENAEYEDAKQEQSFLEGRIATLEAQLRNAAVIEKSNGDKVGIGSKVVIKGSDGEETFTIVGSAEAAPREGRISNESPVGVALMGHKKGDTVTVQAPSGPIEYTLVRIS